MQTWVCSRPDPKAWFHQWSDQWAEIRELKALHVIETANVLSVDYDHVPLPGCLEHLKKTSNGAERTVQTHQMLGAQECLYVLPGERQLALRVSAFSEEQRVRACLVSLQR